MRQSLKEQVRRRAREPCEYCAMPARFYRYTFPVDHILAQHYGGKTVLGNLALACLNCNSNKGSNIAGIDFLDGSIHPLFHPRHDRWKEHFYWDGARLVGSTAVGRATIAVLKINHIDYIEVRESLIVEGEFP